MPAAMPGRVPATLSSMTMQSAGAKPMRLRRMQEQVGERLAARRPWSSENIACSNSGNSPVWPSVMCIFDTLAEVATQ